MKRKQLAAFGAIIVIIFSACANPFFPEKRDRGGANPEVPVISSHPQGAEYTIGDEAEALTVDASAGDGRELSYQWYRNAQDSNEGGTAIANKTDASYTPPTDVTGSVYYYVVVTNTLNGKKAAAVSDTAEVTVGGKIIRGVVVTITTPVKGSAPDTTAAAEDAGYACGAVLWSPQHDFFLGDTVYTATVTLTAKEGCTFDSELTAAINDNEAEITDNTEEAITLSLTFDATLTKTVASMSIKNQPSELSYTYGDTLDLAGLVVTLAFDDNTSEDIALADFGTNISTHPANGTALSRTGHNDIPVVVSFGGLTENTNNLTVNPKEIYFSPSVSSEPILTPMTTSLPIRIDINGLIPPDTATVSVTNEDINFTFNGSGHPYSSISYNGTAAFSNPYVTVNFSVNAGSNYTTITTTFTVRVYDGQANYTGASGTYDRRIPVNSSNISAFYTYANTAAGRTRHYKLMGNVSLSATIPNNWTAIGTSANQFTGSFNGQGYTISNLNINKTASYQGMFGYIGSGGMVQNVGLVGGSVSGGEYVGGVAGYNNRTVQNCYATGSVSGGINVGGVVGSNNIVQNSVALNLSVRTPFSYAYIGRVVGYNNAITNNYARSTGMTVQYIWDGTTGTNKTINAGLTTNDGADVSADTGAGQYNNQSFWSGTMGWDFTNVWQWNSTTNLPILRGFSGAQNHTVQ